VASPDGSKSLLQKIVVCPAAVATNGSHWRRLQNPFFLKSLARTAGLASKNKSETF
jgi:hypothetical protein